MSADALGYLDYLKAAFHRRIPVPLLGAMPVNYLALAAFAVLGIANPGFWFVGAAAELAYLIGLSSSTRFQKLIRGERLSSAKQSWEADMQQAVDRLSPISRDRYLRLLDQCRQVVGVSERLEGDDLGSVRKVRMGGLNQMLWIFLRLLASKEVLEQNLIRVNRQVLEQDIESLEGRVQETEPNSALFRSLGGTLEIQKKRLDNLDRAKESHTVIEAELDRIEHHVVLIREEAAVTGKAEILSDRLDSVSGALAETNRWMEQNASIFGQLGADPLGHAPADLPEIRMAELEG